MGGIPWPAFVSGGSRSSQDSSIAPDDVSEEEDLFGYVMEEVTGYGPSDDVSKGSSLVRILRQNLRRRGILRLAPEGRAA